MFIMIMLVPLRSNTALSILHRCQSPKPLINHAAHLAKTRPLDDLRALFMVFSSSKVVQEIDLTAGGVAHEISVHGHGYCSEWWRVREREREPG